MSKEKDPMRVRAGRKSKTKGNNNERALAKTFQTWWGSGEWARTPASGGWATPAAREAFRTCGDIITTATDFPFCLEAKKCEGWTLDQLIHNEKCIVFQWWKQVVDETPPGLTPLLVMARNHIPHAVMFDPTHINELGSSNVWRNFIHLQFEKPGHPTLIVMALSSLFEIDPTYFGKKDTMTEKKDEDTNPGRPNPADRPHVPEPVIPTCDKCGQPLTRCQCTDNNLRK